MSRIIDLSDARPLIVSGVWRARCARYEILEYRKEKRLVDWWAILAGPYDETLQPYWAPGLEDRVFPDYDQPDGVEIPAFYGVEVRNGRITAKGDKYRNDLWRLLGKPQRRDRLPSRDLIGCEAYIVVTTVVKDAFGYDRQPYSKVALVLKAATERLSINDIKSDGIA